MTRATIETVPALLRVQEMLGKIDQLRLPPGSRRDVECILVRQAAREVDRALPTHAGHGHRTALVAQALGCLYRLEEEALHHLKLAAYLHDIGLLALPQSRDEFDTQLYRESYRMIQNHARLGGSLLEPFAFLRSASIIVAHHHERWDGGGYPYGIRGPFIPIEARILSVADAFDAIEVPANDSQDVRDYVAYRIIRVAAGTQFDPSIVKLLGQVLERRGSILHGE